MVMSINARKAFEELKNLGAPVRDWGKNEGYGKHVAFVLIWANDDTSEIYADRSGRYIKEQYVDGKYINPFGIRQDIHEILKKYNLVTDWWHEGQLIIYNDPDAPGYHHIRD